MPDLSLGRRSADLQHAYRAESWDCMNNSHRRSLYQVNQGEENEDSAFLLRSLARGRCLDGEKALITLAYGDNEEEFYARSPQQRRVFPATVAAPLGTCRTPSLRRRVPLSETPDKNGQAGQACEVALRRLRCDNTQAVNGLRKPAQRKRSQRRVGCRRFVAIRLDAETPTVEVPGAGSDFASALADSLALTADARRSRISIITRFHARTAPTISVHDYIARIAKHFKCSDECFVLASIYLDRVAESHPAFAVNKLSVHRLLLTSVVVAAKFFDDMFYSNAYYARVGGVSAGDLNEMEGQFLSLVQWRLHVLPEEYSKCCKQVLVASKQERSGCGGERGLAGEPKVDVIKEAREWAVPAG